MNFTHGMVLVSFWLLQIGRLALTAMAASFTLIMSTALLHGSDPLVMTLLKLRGHSQQIAFRGSSWTGGQCTGNFGGRR